MVASNNSGDNTIISTNVNATSTRVSAISDSKPVENSRHVIHYPIVIYKAFPHGPATVLGAFFTDMLRHGVPEVVIADRE